MEYDIDRDESSSAVLIRLISSMKGVEPEELDPLHYSVDPDALDTFVSSLRDGSDAGNATIQLNYEGYHVCIEGGERIVISSINEDSSQARSHPN